MSQPWWYAPAYFDRADEDVPSARFEKESRLETTPKAVTSFHVLIEQAATKEAA